MRVVLLVVILLGGSADVWAQRGVEAQRVSAIESATDHFPGAFDAGSLDRGRTTIDMLPLPGIHHGITDELTVGGGALPYLSLLGGKPGFSLEARYRLFGSQRWASTATISAGLASFGDREEAGGSLVLKHATAVLTLERRANPRRSVSLSLYAGGFALDTRSSEDPFSDLSSSIRGAALVVGHHHFPTGWFGYQLALAWVPILSGSLETPGGGLEIDATAITVPLGGRVRLFLRPRRSWLVSLGADVIPPGVPIPHLGLRKEW